MAETAFAQGEANWDGFEIAYETAEYHSDWEEYYSDGGFYEDENVVPSIAGKKKVGGGVGGVGLGNGKGVKVGGNVGGGSSSIRAKIPPRKRRKIEDGVPGVRVGEEGDGGKKKGAGTAMVIVPVTVKSEDIVVGGEEKVVNGSGCLERASSVELVDGQGGVVVASPPLVGDNGVLAREPAKNIERGQKQADTRKRKPSTEGTESQ